MSENASNKLAIATYFIMSSPTGEVDDVLGDVKRLMSSGGKDHVLNAAAIESILRDYNHEQLCSALDPSTGKPVLVSACARVPGADDCYLEPVSNRVLHFDHTRRIFTEEPNATPPSQGSEEHAALRVALHDQLSRYLAESFKVQKSACAVYLNSSEESRFDILISSKNVNLDNFWTGSWRSSYQLNLLGPSNASSGAQNCQAELTGSVKSHVHYFEDGNVQLTSQADLPATSIAYNSLDAEQISSVAKRVIDTIAKFENEYQGELEEMYVNMHRTTFKAMRRMLPVNRQRFVWLSSAHSLASSINT